MDRAGTILEMGRRFGVDPLLIVQWQGESGMATVVPPVSANGADNGGNLTWAAAEPYAAAWGCTPGAEVHYPDGRYLFASDQSRVYRWDAAELARGFRK